MTDTFQICICRLVFNGSFVSFFGAEVASVNLYVVVVEVRRMTLSMRWRSLVDAGATVHRKCSCLAYVRAIQTLSDYTRSYTMR